jgi:hypothetical protein
MANITDPRVIKFVNETIRPLAEEARLLKARVNDMNVKWSSEIQSLCPNTTDLIADGRDAEGISRLTGQNVNDVQYALAVNIGALVDASIEKPCVRPLVI